LSFPTHFRPSIDGAQIFSIFAQPYIIVAFSFASATLIVIVFFFFVVVVVAVTSKDVLSGSSCSGTATFVQCRYMCIASTETFMVIAIIDFSSFNFSFFLFLVFIIARCPASYRCGDCLGKRVALIVWERQCLFEGEDE